MKHIIGLDLSTSIIGYSIVNEDRQLLNFGRIKLSKENKLAFAYNSLKEILQKNPVDKAIIEDIFLGLNPSTFKELAKLRGITELLLDVHQIKHSAIMPSKARNKVFGNGKLKKEECYTILKQRFPNVGNDRLKLNRFRYREFEPRWPTFSSSYVHFRPSIASDGFPL